MKIKFFSSYHKNFLTPTRRDFVSVFACGPERRSLDIQSDIIDGSSFYLNLAEENEQYCELTMLYFVWKNLITNLDFVGFCHYRRYFDFTVSHVVPDRAIYFRGASQKEIDRLTGPTQLENLLPLINNADFILPYPGSSVFNGELVTLAERFQRGEPNTWPVFLEILLSLFPKYRNKMHLFYERRSMHYWNLFAAHRDACNDYCEELFAILRSMQKHYTSSERKHLLPKRSLGGWGEIFLSFYVLANNLNIVSVPCIQLEN